MVAWIEENISEGGPIETIAEILGHTDTKTTILYLGLNMEDQASAMRKLAEFQEQNRFPQNYGNINRAREKSGQSWISVRETYWLEPVLNHVRFTTPIESY